MGVEFATCKTCGHIVDREYRSGRTQWYCQHCNKGVKPLWTSEPPCFKTPTESEPYEPIDGEPVEIDIDAFQSRMNHSPYA